MYHHYDTRGIFDTKGKIKRLIIKKKDNKYVDNCFADAPRNYLIN